MADKVTQLAQAAADGLSRRSFLGRFGRTAAVAAGVLGGMLMIPHQAQAGRRCESDWDCPQGQYCHPVTRRCLRRANGDL